MADNKNFKLSDEMLLNATGGLSASEHKLPEFDALGSVVTHLGGRQYQVLFDDGAMLFATNRTDTVVPEGTKVGLYAIAGGWTMHVLGND
ncbi:hypothetical protein [Oribacterium sp. P6A1]|uniref:hypothetical protein n=1 Tax=Oribacterium sp. P6A1 TaxID=1410612 RepID=UPI0005668E68|nr:hypothetical protein [Oribacterium sp. P6A1]